MRISKRIVTVILAMAALGLVVTLPSACGSSDDSVGTTGKRISLGVKVVGSPEAKAPFANSQGWNVTLSKALIATGALYYYDGATIFSLNAPHDNAPPEKAQGQRLWEMFVEKTAFAHPGHYIPGNAKGEYLNPSSADLKTETVLGQGAGVSGAVRSATFSFQSPAVGPFAAELGSHVVVLEGTATKGAETRMFRAELDAVDIVNTKNLAAVDSG